MNLAFILFIGGAVVISWIYFWSRQQHDLGHSVDLDQVIRDVPAAATGDAVLVASTHGKLIYINEPARRLLQLGDSIPHLERIAQMAEPSHNFLQLFASDGQSSFQIGGKWVEATSHRIPAGPEMRTVVVIRELTANSHSSELLDMGMAMSIINEIGELVDASMGLEAVAQKLLMIAKKGIGFDAAEICMWNAEEQALYPHGWMGDSRYLENLKAAGGKYLIDEGISGWIARNRKPVLLVSDEDFAAIQPKLASEPYKSYVAVPLHLGDRFIGTLEIASMLGENYSQSDLTLLQAISKPVAVAIFNAQIYGEQVSRVGDLTNLQQVVTDQQGDETDTTAIYKALNQRIADLVSANICGVFLYDADRVGLVPQLPFHGMPDALTQTIFIPVPEGSPQEVIWKERPHWIVNNIQEEPLFEEIGLRPVTDVAGIKNSVWVPLQLKERRFGILAIGNKRAEGGFDDYDIQNITVLAAQASIVIENIRLYQREKRMDTELVGLQEITNSIGALSHETEFYGEITERISKLMGIAMCGILLHDAENSRLTRQLPFYGVSDEAITDYAIPLTPGSIMDELWSDEQYWYSNRVLTDPLAFAAGLNELAEEVGVEKTLVAVLHAGGERLGVVQISNKLDSGDFHDGDARLLMIFATQIAAIIQNARLYREAQQSAEQAQGLRRVAELAGNVLTTEETFTPVLSEIAEILSSELVFINVLDQQKGSLITYPRWVYGAELSEPFVQNIYSPGFENSVAASRRSYMSNDVPNDSKVLPGYMQMAQRMSIRNAVLVPLVFGDRTLGELGVANRHNNIYTSDDLEIAKVAAAQIASALDRLLLYESTGQNLNRRMEELDAISRVSNELTLTLEFDRILTVIREESINATKADDCTMALLSDKELWHSDTLPHVERRLGYAQEITALTDIELEAISREEEPVLITDYEFSTMTAMPVEAHSALAVVITYLNRPVGIIHVFHKEPNRFDDRASAFLMTMAAKASLGYGNASRYQEQFERSARLRRRVEQLNSIFELGQMFQTNATPIDILEAISFSIQQSVGYDIVVVLLADEKTQKLQRVAHAGLPVGLFNESKGNTISQDELKKFLKNDYRVSESFFLPAEDSDKWLDIDIAALDTSYEGSRTIEDISPNSWRDGDKLLITMSGASGATIGVICLDRPHNNRRPERNTIEVLEIFAHQAASTIENSRLYLSTVRNAEQEARLTEVMEAVSSTLDIPQIIEAVAEGTLSMLPFVRMTVAISDMEDKGFDIIRIIVQPEDSLAIEKDHIETLENSVLKRSITEKADFIYRQGDPEIDQYDDLRGWYEKDEKTSFVLPLLTGGETLGVIHIGSDLPDSLGLSEFRPLLRRMAQLVASAVQNARLFDQAVNLQVLTESVVESIQQGIVVLDNSQKIISSNEFMGERYGWDESATGQKIFTYRPELIDNLREDLTIVLKEGIPRERNNQLSNDASGNLMVSNYYLYPLRTGTSVHGAVILVEDVTTRSNLEQTMEARANQLAALTEISSRITSTLERGEVVQLALEEMSWLIPHDAITLWRRNGSYMVLEGAMGNVDESAYEEDVRVSFSEQELMQKVVDVQRVVSIGKFEQASNVMPIHNSAESCMGVPLVNQGHVVGLMVLSSDEKDAYNNTSDQNIAFAFASQVAIAEANADLFEQTFDRTNELGILLEAAQATALSTDLDSVFRVIVELMFGALDMDNCTIMLWDEVDNQLEVQVDMNRHGNTDQILEYGTTMNLDQYPAKLRSLRERQVVVIAVNDDNTYPKEIEELKERNSFARMLVPLVARENSMGLVQLEQTTAIDEAGTQQKIRLARALGAQVAIAIENARLAAETTAHFEESLLINDLSQAISSTLDLNDMIDVVRTQIPNVASASEIYLALYEAKTEEITFPMAVKNGEPYDMAPRKLNTDEVSFIINQRRPLNLGADYYSPDEIRKSLGITNGEGDAKSYLGVPIIAGDEVFGVLAIRDSERTRAFSINEQRILTTVGSQLGAAIQNAQLFRRVRSFADDLNLEVAERTSELEDERDRINTLYRITSELTQTLDEERLMENALKMVANAVNAQDGVIMQLDPITDQLYSRTVLNPKSLIENTGSEHPTHPAEQLARWLVAEEEEYLVVEDLHKVDYWDKKIPGAGRWRSALAVPLETNEELLGVMLLLSKKKGTFNESHLRLTAAAVSQVASSINNAQLYKLIRDQAERLGLLLRTEQDSAEKNKAILEGIADGVILADHEGRIIMFNLAAERILQVPREQALDRTIDTLPGLETDAIATWSRALAGNIDHIKDNISEEFLNERLTIGERTVSVHLSPVYTGERFLGTVSVFRDITREVEAERSKSLFVSNVSHEFRTPLTAIKGFNDLLLMGAFGDFNDGQKEMLNTIKSNVSRLTLLVDDVLNISRIDAGREHLVLSDIDLNELISSEIEALKLRPKHQGKELIVKFEPTPKLPQLQADKDKVVRVMSNIIDNAFNYTTGGGTIEIQALVNPDDDSQMLISVKDNGVGIPEEFHDQLWERFVRHENTALTLDVAGTGLGLPIVKELIKMHGGKIWFETEIGVGTIFFITLPLKQPEYRTSIGAVSGS